MAFAQASPPSITAAWVGSRALQVHREGWFASHLAARLSPRRARTSRRCPSSGAVAPSAAAAALALRTRCDRLVEGRGGGSCGPSAAGPSLRSRIMPLFWRRKRARCCLRGARRACGGARRGGAADLGGKGPEAPHGWHARGAFGAQRAAAGVRTRRARTYARPQRLACPRGLPPPAPRSPLRVARRREAWEANERLRSRGGGGEGGGEAGVGCDIDSAVSAVGAQPHPRRAALSLHALISPRLRKTRSDGSECPPGRNVFDPGFEGSGRWRPRVTRRARGFSRERGAALDRVGLCIHFLQPGPSAEDVFARPAGLCVCGWGGWGVCGQQRVQGLSSGRDAALLRARRCLASARAACAGEQGT